MIFGIDISHWQTNDAKSPQYFFDPAVAKEKGVQFAYIRAADGIQKDTAFETFAQSFYEAGMPFGCYYYARPAGTTYGSATAQADFFWNLIKDKKYTLPPALDLECDGVGLSYIKTWLERIKLLSGMTPIIYTREKFWSALKDSANAVWAIDYPIWLASYFYSMEKFPVYGIPDVVLNSTTLPVVPDPWKKKGKTWTLWQYCRYGDGEYYGGNYAKHTNETSLDLDGYRGTVEELIAELGGNSVPEIPDTEPETPKAKYAEVLVSWLRFRSKPSLYAGETLVIGKGAQLKITGDIVSGDIDYYPVEMDGYAGYISANPQYIKIILK